MIKKLNKKQKKTHFSNAIHKPMVNSVVLNSGTKVPSNCKCSFNPTRSVLILSSRCSIPVHIYFIRRSRNNGLSLILEGSRSRLERQGHRLRVTQSTRFSTTSSPPQHFPCHPMYFVTSRAQLYAVNKVSPFPFPSSSLHAYDQEKTSIFVLARCNSRC